MKAFKNMLLAGLFALAFAAGIGLAPGLEMPAWARCDIGDPACTP